MAMILFALALGVMALRNMWRNAYAADLAGGIIAARNIKQATNILIVSAQTVGYVAELLAGTRTTTPGTTSTTAVLESSVIAGITVPSAATFGSRTASTLQEA